LALFGTQNWIFGPFLGAINRILICEQLPSPAPIKTNRMQLVLFGMQKESSIPISVMSACVCSCRLRCARQEDDCPSDCPGEGDKARHNTWQDYSGAWLPPPPNVVDRCAQNMCGTSQHTLGQPRLCGLVGVTRAAHN
jgi:hypothetical protein